MMYTMNKSLGSTALNELKLQKHVAFLLKMSAVMLLFMGSNVTSVIVKPGVGFNQ